MYLRRIIRKFATIKFTVVSEVDPTIRMPITLVDKEGQSLAKMLQQK